MIFCIHLYKNCYLRLDDGCMFFFWIVRPSPCPNIGQVSKQLNIRLLHAAARRSQSLSTAELMEVKRMQRLFPNDGIELATCCMACACMATYAYAFWIIVSDLPWMLQCLCDCVTVISWEGLLVAFRGNNTMQTSFWAFQKVECNCSLPWLNLWHSESFCVDDLNTRISF